MESSRFAAGPGRHKPGTRVAAALCVVILALRPGVAAAGQGPGVKDLKDQATRAQNQIEQLTEQYNGLRVQLDQAVRAADVARSEATAASAAYQTMRRQAGRIAATSYMHDQGIDPAMAFISSPNPARLLDDASTLDYFANQADSRVRGLARTLQNAVRAGQAAQARVDQVQALKAAIEQKRAALQNLYDTARQRIAKIDPRQLADLPLIDGDASSTALQALQWALRVRGKPYVWGAAGPNTFDCSGLTMWAYHQVGITLPHYTGSQWNAGTHISKDQLRPGDLVFFYPDLHHMGMYVGHGMIVHAPHTGDVVRLAPMAGRPFAGAVRVA